MEKSIILCIFCLSCFFNLPAQDPICPDTEGSKDYPLISRYEGSCIIGYREDNFTSYELALGPQVERNNIIVASKTKTIEGKLTRILYGLENERSPLEVYRNYESAIKSANFKLLYSCKETSCGNQRLFSNRAVYEMAQRLDSKGNLSEYAFSAPKNVLYSAYQGTKDSIQIYISLLVAKSGSNVGDLQDKTVVLIDVIETTIMESDQILVEDVESAIDSDGYARFYGIYFDFNSSNLQENSDYELQVMADYLNDHADENVFIVGHTDNIGSHDFNLKLSKERALAVVRALSSRFGIGVERMKAEGVGALSPVTKNESDRGRALNRRVEMVPR